MSKTALPPVGAKVKLRRDGSRWWDVRAADDRFAILTRQAAFKPKGEVCYTILDAEEGVRGPCNLIGQSWHETMPDEACQELLEELQIGAKVQAWNAGDRSFDMDAHIAWMDENQRFGVEISHRNRVSLDIGEIRPAESSAVDEPVYEMGDPAAIYRASAMGESHVIVRPPE